MDYLLQLLDKIAMVMHPAPGSSRSNRLLSPMEDTKLNQTQLMGLQNLKT